MADPPHLELTGRHGPPPPLRLTGHQRRRRRLLPALTAAGLIVIAGALLLLFGGSGRSPLRAQARVGAVPYGPAHPGGFLGLSIEYPALGSYLGSDPAQIDPVFVALVRALAPGAAPVLRIGGDSADHTWYSPVAADPPPGLSYRITPTWIAAARALVSDSGAKLVLDLNLAAGRPALAAAEANALITGIGAAHIAALEIGNEPDIYAVAPWYRTRTHVGYARNASTWSEVSFYRQFATFARVLPALPLAGPSYAEKTWVRNLPAFLSADPGVGLVTDHRYPLRGCLGHTNEAPPPTISNLMAPAASAGLAAAVAPDVAAAHRAGRPFRLDEINSAACRGKLGVSNTFASALWALDALFSLASVGVDGVNIHTLPGAPYEPFTFTRTGRGWSAGVRPIYYGMLMFARAFPPGARLLPVQVAAPLRAWATRAPNGRLRVVLINPTSRPLRVHLALPPGAPQLLSLQELRAPDLRSTGDVSLGGRSFSGSTLTGVLPSPVRRVIRTVRGGATVLLTGPSAVLLTG